MKRSILSKSCDDRARQLKHRLWHRVTQFIAILKLLCYIRGSAVWNRIDAVRHFPLLQIPVTQKQDSEPIDCGRNDRVCFVKSMGHLLWMLENGLGQSHIVLIGIGYGFQQIVLCLLFRLDYMERHLISLFLGRPIYVEGFLFRCCDFLTPVSRDVLDGQAALRWVYQTFGRKMNSYKIHSETFTTKPAGAPTHHEACSRFALKTNSSGAYCPTALKQASAVTVWPFSFAVTW